MSQLAKLLQVLDLFTEERTTVSAEEVAVLMALPRTTTFRYLKQLTDTGLLTKLSARYALGARIIQLDHKIRRFDPLLLSSRDVMKALASATACSIVLSSLYGDEIVNVHHEAGQDGTAFTFGRGRSLPLWRGAVSRIILAHLPLARLKRLHARFAGHPDVRELGADLAAFLQFFRDCRRRGHYVSHGEVDPGITGIACPIVNADDQVIGGLCVVFDSRREPLFNEDTLAGMVRDAASEISARLRRATSASAAQQALAPAAPSVKPARRRVGSSGR